MYYSMYVQPPVNTVAAILLDEVANTILPSGQSFARIKVIRNDLPVPPGACKNTIPPSFLSAWNKNNFTHLAGLLAKGHCALHICSLLTLVIIYFLWYIYTLANLSLSTVCGCGRPMEEASVSNSAANLHSLFAVILTWCETSSPLDIYEHHKEAMAEDSYINIELN